MGKQLESLIISLATLWLVFAGFAHMVGGKALSERVLRWPLHILRWVWASIARPILRWAATVLIDGIEWTTRQLARGITHAINWIGRRLANLWHRLRHP